MDREDSTRTVAPSAAVTAGFAGGGAPAPPEPAAALADWLAEHAYLRVPLETTGVGHFQASGEVSGHPVKILVDTGAASTVIDLEWARARGFALEATGMSGGGAGAGALDIYRVPGAAIRIAGIAIATPGPLAVDLGNVAKALAAKGMKAPQVVLGADVMNPRKAIIDYGTATLYLCKR
jgi:predicted aspartyl protease